jgi:hypothetical protein
MKNKNNESNINNSEVNLTSEEIVSSFSLYSKKKKERTFKLNEEQNEKSLNIEENISNQEIVLEDRKILKDNNMEYIKVSNSGEIYISKITLNFGIKKKLINLGIKSKIIPY